VVSPTPSPGVSPGASGGPTQAPGPSPTAGSTPAASSQALIAADLEAGAIDLGTALELRAWALFGDPRLPERYDGSGSTGEDHSLFDEIAANLDSLPADTQAELARYLQRPTHPDSPFSQSAAVAAGGTAGAIIGASVVTAQETASGQPCGEGKQWFYRDWTPAGGGPDDGFRIWGCAQNPRSLSVGFNKIVEVGTRLWPRMTLPVPQGMGKPVPDLFRAGDGSMRGDGNGKVDVYLVDALSPCRERGVDLNGEPNCEGLTGNAVAAAPKDFPLHCNVPGFPTKGCSAYMLIGSNGMDAREFAGVFAHEFFHVLQHAHNGEIPTTWYHEASATWAGWFFEPASYSEKAFDRFREFQKVDRSLLWYDWDQDYQYEAWGYPLLQYVEGGEGNVYQAWAEIEQANDMAMVDAAVDRHFPFADWFREFAVANAQPRAFIPGASAGLDDIRWQTHPQLTDFPTDHHHVHGELTTIAMGQRTYPVSIDPLTAQYDEFQVTDDNIRQIIIDRIGINGADWVDVDVLAQVGDGDNWKRFRGDQNGRLVLCRDRAEENVSGALTVVLSNHVFGRDGNAPDDDLRATGNYLISAAEETTECNESFVILHGRMIGDRDDTLETTHASFEFFIKWNRPSDWRDPLNMVFESGSFEFESTVHTVCGGSWSDGGQLVPEGDPQRLSKDDGQGNGVSAVLSDQRGESNRVLIHFSASYEMPNDDPLCQPPDRGSITACPIFFTVIDDETLTANASCEDGFGTTWTATLVQAHLTP
jgi:hypothetical protein